jgi:hypothetical protein
VNGNDNNNDGGSSGICTVGAGGPCNPPEPPKTIPPPDCGKTTDCPGLGNFCHSHKSSPLCVHTPTKTVIIHKTDTHTNTIVIHKTKTVHKKDLAHILTVFVPKIGLVEPFNCKLNENTGKIGCEFIIIKVIN